MELPRIFRERPATVVVPRDVIVADGPDTEAFLQGQLSQDIAALAVGTSAWSLLLEPQGKVHSWLRVSRTGDQSFVLDLDAGAGEAALKRLTRFKLRTECELALETWNTVAVRGPGSSSEVGAGGVIAADPEWPGVEGIDLLGPAVEAPAGLAVATIDELEQLRVLCGVPKMGAELDDSVIPASAGIVDRSVSFTKGCYTGQELVARIDSRGGNVPTRLCGVVIGGSASEGAEVQVGGESVGVLRSLVPVGGETVGLAYIKRSVDAPSPATVAGAEAEIRALPLIG